MAVPQRSRAQSATVARPVTHQDDVSSRSASAKADLRPGAPGAPDQPPASTKPSAKTKASGAARTSKPSEPRSAAAKTIPVKSAKSAKGSTPLEAAAAGSDQGATAGRSDETAARAQPQQATHGAPLSFESIAAVFKMPAMGQDALQQWFGGMAQPAAFQPMQHAVEAMGQSIGATLQSLVGLTVSASTLQDIQKDYVEQATKLWNQALEQPGKLAPKDRRFAAPEWSSNPGSAFMAAMYLLNATTLRRLADGLEGDDKARERVRFAVQQWVDAASPSNFLAFNPEALKKAVETKGDSLKQGLLHLVNDLRQGHLSQTDESLFEVGRNVATTAGSVVFENEFFQLIEYAPLTSTVRERPILFVPPCINKFYILDLQPDNSLVRHALSKGQRVFMVSWVNADESLAQATWDDYVDKGVTTAINTVRDVTGSEQINALGFCVGGTLLSTALALEEAKGNKPVASLTLLTTFLDFSNAGVMDVFVDEATVKLREMSIGPDSPQHGGLMKGGELAATFSFLRPNDLVWNYVVGNYLKGETPPAFDLLYWNGDSTNLPGPMYTWYLRHTYLENKLREPNALTVCGQPLDLGKLTMPTFVYGSREDHIVPWDGAYASTQIVKGPCTFVLGASGHIAGVINPPEKKKRQYWTTSPLARTLPSTADEWISTADEHPGSWWPRWIEWLDQQSGEWVEAPKQAGSRRYPVIEPAPGRYVMRKA